jgi:voltage-gated potassium channel
MQDFVQFLRYLFRIIYFVRGVIVAFAVLLTGCVVLMALAERMPVGQATYLILITSLTVGYGDIAPATALGRTVSVAAGILGLILNGLVIAVAVRALSEAVQDKAQRMNVPVNPKRRGHL